MARHVMKTKGLIFDLSGTLAYGTVEDGEAVIQQERPDVKKAFEWLAEREVKVGIVTSYKEENAKKILSKMGIIERFEPEHVVGADSERPLVVTRTEARRAKGLKGILGVMQDVEVQVVDDHHRIKVKPHSEPVRYLLHDWQLQPDQVQYIGDDDYVDRQCAVGAGVDYIKIPRLVDDLELSLLNFVRDRIQ